MEKIVKLIFLFLIYCSNVSTAIFIYPIIYLIFGVNNEPLEWYYFGIIFSVYELGKFFGLFMWDFLFHKFSNIILIISSLLFICILNISYILSFNIYHILIIRFLSGFFNNIGKNSKDIYIQLGFKERLQLIIFFISIFSTLISLILPSLISLKIMNTKEDDNYIKKIYQITFIFALINILSIIISLILIFNKILKIKNFMRMNNNFEKLEYSRNIGNKNNKKTPQSTIEYNRSRDLKHSKKMINIKSKDITIDNQNSRRNINYYYGEKMTSNRCDVINKKEDDSKFGKRGSLNLFAKSKNSETGGKEIIQPIDFKLSYKKKNKLNNSENIKNNKKSKYIFIHILSEISDILTLIWTLIILHIEYDGNCLYIAFVYACIRLLGDIISFPINTIIIKNISYYTQHRLKHILKNIIIMSISLFFVTIISNIFLFMYYYYFIKNKIILFVLFFTILIRNIFSIINIQLLKIYSAKDFNIHSNNMILLRTYKNYSGCIVKTIIFLIGSYGYYLIYNISFKIIPSKIFIEFSKLIFIIYFIVFPAVINIILIIGSKFFMQ